MYVDKDRATKMLEYMQNTNKLWVQNGVRSRVGADTDPRARFSFQKFLQDNNIFEDAMERNDDMWIACPFHEDASPSCSINEKMYKYHCFSCGSKGNLINLITEYKSRYENSGMGYYQVLNSFLSKDREAQAELGFDTIYVNSVIEDKTFNGDAKKFIFKPRNDGFTPTSYSELADFLIEKRASLKQIKLFVILMQNNITPLEIFREIYGDSNVDNTTEIDLSKLLQF